MSSIQSTHPLYDAFKDAWVLLRDCYSGEQAVKAKRTLYLPPTKGMTLDGMSGQELGAQEYAAYLRRAVFHNYVKDAVEALLGFMHQQPPTIELPAQMEDLREKATNEGEPLDLLLRRINEQQLVTGRLGLLVDLPDTAQVGAVLPYIALYTAESIINWDGGTEGPDRLSNLSLVVLDESGPERVNIFEWKHVEQYRVLMLGPQVGENGALLEGTQQYSVGVFRADVAGTASANGVANTLDFTPTTMVVPQLMGQTSKEIPFVFINSKDIVASPDEPPLLALGNLCLAIYRGEADYRQTLHKQGQDTLVVIGGAHRDDLAGASDGQWRIGSGASIELDAQPGADAKFIGISADGIAHQREALNDDKQLAQAKSASLLSSDQGRAESGEALNIRVAARTATLTQIAHAGAAGLEKVLRIIARWRGLDPDQVKVTPNTEFAVPEITGQDLVQLMTAKRLGAPLSLESIHDLLVDRGMTSRTFEEELALLEAEEDMALTGSAAGLGNPGGTGAGGNPDDTPPEA